MDTNMLYEFTSAWPPLTKHPLIGQRLCDLLAQVATVCFEEEHRDAVDPDMLVRVAILVYTDKVVVRLFVDVADDKRGDN